MVTYLFITHWHWWGLAALLIIGELLAPCRYFLALAIAAAVSGLLVRIWPDFNGFWQVGVFLVLSIISLFIAYRYRRRKPKVDSADTESDPQ